MTPENLEAIRKRAEAATSGIGFRHRLGKIFNYQLVKWHDEVPHDAMPHTEILGEIKYEQDAKLLSCARTDILALLDEIERLRGVLDLVKSTSLLYMHVGMEHLLKDIGEWPGEF